tara:strand:- start:861 stop:1076 length:216 start_codon:yes stop_codon:yes gene_type:complete
MKIELNSGEVNSFANDIYKILMEIPLYYVVEVLESAHSDRVREGKLIELDMTSSSEEEEEDEDDNNSSDNN